MVAATPPPGVAIALLQSTLALLEERLIEAVFAAAISDGLKRDEVVVSFFAVGIAARDEMRGVITAWGPDQEDDFALPHSQASQPKFTIAFAIVFCRDHRVVENGFQLRKINLVLPDIFPSLRLVPSDHLSECICSLTTSQPDCRCEV
jgi:hypothetical protein